MKLQTLSQSAPIVDGLGNPLAPFVMWWAGLVSRLNALGGDLTAMTATVTALSAAVVHKAATAAWATPTGTFDRTTFGAYVGQVVSDPPTQAQVQAIDDQVKLLSQHLAALISDLRGNGALS